jgi:hypothetical protein
VEDWNDLEEMLELLKPFNRISKLGQEKGTACGSITNVLGIYEFLLAQLESWEKAASRGPGRKETGFRSVVNLAWNLLKKYYGMTDKSSVYVAAMVLDPQHKMAYLEQHWTTDWLEKAKMALREFYNQYKVKEESSTPAQANITSSRTQSKFIKSKVVQKTPLWGAEALDINQFLLGETTQRVEDELEAYLNDSVLKFGTHEERVGFDLDSWWRSNATVYPTLTRMYWDISSIPMMSAEPERVFSEYALSVNSQMLTLDVNS